MADATLAQLYSALRDRMISLRNESSPNTPGYVASGDVVLPAGWRSGYNGPGFVDQEYIKAKALAGGDPGYEQPYQPNDWIPEGAYVGLGDLVGQANFSYEPTTAANYVGNPLAPTQATIPALVEALRKIYGAM
jgi:hypothetical protein